MPLRIDALRRALAVLPRTRLAHLPTPLEPLLALSNAIGGVELWIKRDDLTGLAMGGNKTRQLEFTLGEALAQGADCAVQGAGAQSNHCRQAAAACARLGLECHLLLTSETPPAPTPQHPTPNTFVQGNLLLDRIFGARIHWSDAPLGDVLEAEKDALAERLRDEGRRPYVIGGSRGKLLGAAAYVEQTCELLEQCVAAGLEPDFVYACATGATFAGLALGRRVLGLDCTLQAIAPIRWDFDAPARAAETANRLAAELALEERVDTADLRYSEDYVGPAYGVMTREARVAIELVARTEGILLDPSYTGKAMAGLMDHVRRGIVRPGSRVLFIHTGGTPALFAHAEELVGV